MKINKKSHRCLTLLLSLILIIIAGCDPDYTGLMRAKLRAMFGDEFKDYYWPSVFFDNFGLGTSYDGKNGNDPSTLKANFISTIPLLIGKDDPTNKDDQISMYGYAAHGKGSKISLTANEQNSAALSLLLPQMFKILNINVGVAWTNGLSSQVSFDDTYERFLTPDKFDTLITNQTNSPTLKKTYQNGKLIVVSSDLLLYGLSIKISATNGFDADLSASLSNAALNSILSSNTSLTISVRHNNDGSYTLSNTAPAIVAMLYKSIPGPLPLTKYENPDVAVLRKYWSNSKFITINDATSLLK